MFGLYGTAPMIEKGWTGSEKVQEVAPAVYNACTVGQALLFVRWETMFGQSL